jgi:hypothetical protein
MKEVLTPLQSEGLLFRRFEPFSLKEIGSRKRMRVYHGVDMAGRYTLVFSVKKKSPVLEKEAREWLALKRRIEVYYGYPILQVVAMIAAPMCFKAQTLLRSEGWRLLDHDSL